MSVMQRFAGFDSPDNLENILKIFTEKNVIAKKPEKFSEVEANLFLLYYSLQLTQTLMIYY